MRIETFNDTSLMLLEIRRAFDEIKVRDCYYYASLRRTLSELVTSYLMG